MDKLFKMIGLLILLFIFWYFIGAFYSASFYLPDWTSDTRFVIITGYIGSVVIINIINYLVI